MRREGKLQMRRMEEQKGTRGDVKKSSNGGGVYSGDEGMVGEKSRGEKWR